MSQCLCNPYAEVDVDRAANCPVHGASGSGCLLEMPNMREVCPSCKGFVSWFVGPGPHDSATPMLCPHCGGK